MEILNGLAYSTEVVYCFIDVVGVFKCIEIKNE